MAKEVLEDEFKTSVEDEYRELYSDRVTSMKSSSQSSQADLESIPLNKIDFLHDVKLKLVVEFGQARMTLGDILSLKKGSLIRVSKAVGEPVEVLAGRTLVARGEIVIVNDRLGIRMTEIIRPEESPINISEDSKFLNDDDSDDEAGS